jgi:hypothetical protein
MEQDHGHEDVRDVLDLHAAKEMQLDPVAPPDPIPEAVQIPDKWYTVCQRSDHANETCWHQRSKEGIREYFRINPDKKTLKNRRSNRSKRQSKKKKLIHEQIKTHRLQAENLQLKLQLLNKK